MNKFEKLKTTVFNMASLVNVLDNKSRDFFLVNNVREQQFGNSGQLTAILKNIDKNATVTRAYRTGEQPGNSQKIVQSLHRFWTNNSVSQ